jgi:hypothetical protein
MLVEAWNTELGNYIALPYGTPHPDVAKWPGYVLVSQQAFASDEKWVLRFWTADPEVENTYNLAQHSFDGEDILKDIYVRTYAVRRKDYVPLAKGGTLSGVLYVRVTAGGTGYDATTTVAFTGGGGTGATGVPIVFRGAVVGVYITSEGENYTGNPYVTFAGTGTGAAATAGGIRQNSLAVLIEEKADRMNGDPEDGLYLKVTRLYHVLPGAVLTSYSSATGGKLKRIRRQKIRLPAYPSVYPAAEVNLIGQKVEALSTVVGWKTTEDWVNSDGTTSDSVPWLSHEETLEPENVKLVTRVKTVDFATEAPPVGRSYLETAGDMAAGAAYGGRRRIPTFPTGITSAGEWENAQAYVVHSEKRPIGEDSPNFTLIVQTCPIPRTRYEFPEVSFQFPALFTWDTTSGSTFLTLINGRLPLRHDQGFQYKSHRTRRVVGALVRKYTVTPNTPALSNQWFLNSPGAGSAFFGQLDANTIYADLGAATGVSISNASGVIEQFDFSTVTGCSQAGNSVAGTDLTPTKGTLPALYRVKAEELVWRGAIYVREYLCIGEDRDLIADANNGRFNSTTDTSAGTWLWCA